MSDITVGGLTFKISGRFKDEIIQVIQDTYIRSPTYRAEVAATSEIVSAIYIGSSIQEFENNSSFSSSARGKLEAYGSKVPGMIASGDNNAYFALINDPRDFILIQDNNELNQSVTFENTFQSVVIHETLHPIETHRAYQRLIQNQPPGNQELNTQKVEQTVLEELKLIAGIDIPDVKSNNNSYSSFPKCFPAGTP